MNSTCFLFTFGKVAARVTLCFISRSSVLEGLLTWTWKEKNQGELPEGDFIRANLKKKKSKFTEQLTMCLELSTYSNLILSNGTVGTYPYFSNNFPLLGKVQLFAPDFTVISGGAGWIAFFPPDLQANNTIGRDVESRQGQLMPTPTPTQVSPIENLRTSQSFVSALSIPTRLKSNWLRSSLSCVIYKKKKQIM